MVATHDPVFELMHINSANVDPLYKVDDPLNLVLQPADPRDFSTDTVNDFDHSTTVDE